MILQPWPLIVRARCELRALTLGMFLLVNAADVAKQGGIDLINRYAKLVQEGKPLPEKPMTNDSQVQQQH